MITNETQQKIHDFVYDKNFDKILDKIIKFSFRNFNQNTNCDDVIKTIDETINEFLYSELIYCMSNVLTTKIVGFEICDSLLNYILNEIIKKYGNAHICSLYKNELKPYLMKKKIDRISNDFN